MTDQADFVQPPRAAVWLVSLFTAAEGAESILGDLLEEYSHLASKSGVAFARNWYWRQTVKTIAHLFGTAFRLAPWSTTAAAAGGCLLLKFVMWLGDKLLSAVTDRYLLFWSAHFKAYIWMLNGLGIEHFIAFMFVGSVVALVVKGREMVTTMTLGLFLGTMAVAGSIAMATRTGDDYFLWRLPWFLADSLVIVTGGAIVRLRRSATNTLRPD